MASISFDVGGVGLTKVYYNKLLTKDEKVFHIGRSRRNGYNER